MKSLIVLSLVLVSCGYEAKKVEADSLVQSAEKEEVKKEEPQSFSVATASKLPVCNENREGALANIRSESRFVVCESGEWNSANMTTGAIATDEEEMGEHCADGGQLIQTFLDKNGNGIRDDGEQASGNAQYVCNGGKGVSGKDGHDGLDGKDGTDGINGTNGVDGAKGDKGDDGVNGAKGDQGNQGVIGVTGSTGAMGATGANGNDNHIATVYDCQGSVWSNRLDPEAYTDMYTKYRVTITTWGDVSVKASIGWGDGNTTNYKVGGTTNWFMTYAKNEAGASTASIQSVFNMKSPANGYTGNLYSGFWTWTLNKTTDQATVVYEDPDLTGGSTISYSLACTKANY